MFEKYGHAPFGRDGVQLAFGRHPDGRIIHISQAARGKFQRCVCPNPACGRPLIAKKGSELEHHFQHAGLSANEKAAGVAPSCSGGQMTALHEFAQQILAESKCLTLPAVEVEFNQNYLKQSDRKMFEFDGAILESRTGDIIPDVIVVACGVYLLIEIFVTHRCNIEKIKKIAELGISALEIDLSQVPRDASYEQIAEAILHTAPREWLFNRKRELLRKGLEEKAKQERAIKETKRVQATAQRKARYGRDLERVRAMPVHSPEPPIKGDSDKLRSVMIREIPGEGFFSVHPSVWKYEVIRRLEHGCDVFGLAKAMRENGLIEPRWQPSKNSRRWNEDAGLATEPARTIETFLELLTREGIAQIEGWKWTFSRHYREAIDEQEQEVAAAERARVERAQRLDALRNLAARAADLGDGVPAFDFNAWHSHSIGDQTPYLIAETGGPPWIKLRQKLIRLIDVLEGKEAPPCESIGLPVAVRLAQIYAEYELKEEEKKLLRIQDLEKQVEHLPDWRSKWLDEPHVELKCSTPRQVARESENGYRRAFDLLAVLRVKIPWEVKLIDELEKKLGTRKWALQFGLQRSEELPGQVSPIDFVSSPDTLKRVLGLLRDTGA